MKKDDKSLTENTEYNISGKENLFGFFRLLLSIDKRQNPEHYHDQRCTANHHKTPRRNGGNS